VFGKTESSRKKMQSNDFLSGESREPNPAAFFFCSSTGTKIKKQPNFIDWMIFGWNCFFNPVEL
jgi:hypothetical protein